MIRRTAALLAALMMLVSFAAAEGELRGYSAEEGYVYVTFGQYYQSIDGGIPDEGTQTWEWHKIAVKEKKAGVTIDPDTLEKDPVLWRVLEADGERALLMSEYVLLAGVQHSNLGEFSSFGGDFSRTDLGKRLNGPFLEDTFTAEEQEALLPYDETTGKVFIPDRATLKNKDYGFTTNKARKAWATEYAVRCSGAYMYQTKNGNHSPYWTRTQSSKRTYQANATKVDGSIGVLSVTGDDVGARPMILLDLARVTVEGGSGTKENPYRLVAGTGTEETAPESEDGTGN